jgi:hypothetical protein
MSLAVGAHQPEPTMLSAWDKIMIQGRRRSFFDSVFEERLG